MSIITAAAHAARAWRRPVAFVAAGAGVTAFAVVGALPAATAAAATPPTGVSPVLQRPANHVTADALPTTQIDGVGWNQAIVGNTVYVAGQFANARPAGAAPGTNLTPRNNLLAYDITTGNLDTSFAPSLDAQAKFVTASPDKSRIYVGGSFINANGVPRYRLAAYSTSTGALITTFAPSLDATVNAIAATNTTFYVAGNFGTANGNSRPYLAAFDAANGALLQWMPTPNAPVQAMVLSPDGSRVIVGGSFTTINNSPAYGLGAIDAATGALLPYAANQVVRDAGANAAILSLTTDGKAVYSTGYTYGNSGNFEGVMSSDPITGSINWLADCHGDSYGAASSGNGIVYTVSHFHNCENIGGFPDTNPRSVWHRTTSFSANATGAVLTNKQGGDGYGNFGGQPSPSLYDWMPDLSAGTVTHDSQAAWNVQATDQYVVEAGEFPLVNNAPQQGLVRFGLPSLATNKQGPNLYSPNYALTATARSATSVRLVWPSNWDRDDQTLTYSIYRMDRGTTTPIKTITADSQSWNLPTLGWNDTGLSPSTTYQYKVKASDPSGNAQGTVWVPVTTSATSVPDSKYAQDVLGANPTDYWRLDQAAGATSNVDYAGFNDLTVGSGVTGGVTGAINGDPDTGSSFSGTQAGLAATKTAIQGPNTFTVAAWFATTSPTGGKIVGFGNKNTDTSSSYDRHVYLDAAGRLNFGVYPNAARTLRSAQPYNDGKYHYVVATLSSAGMVLYADGQFVAGDPDVTAGQDYRGYWRVGGDKSWSGANFFMGRIDDVAIYPTALSAQQVRQQYIDSGRVPPTNSAPKASFTATTNGLSAGFDAGASSDPDNDPLTYAWDFGDKTTGTGVTASHTYDTTGTYTVTLTVTDAAGTTDSSSKSVSVTAPNKAPTASFTVSTDALAATFDAGASTDPEGGTLVYSWDFGDSKSGTGANPSHTYDAAGTYTVRLTVTDPDNASDVTTKTVTVRKANVPPTAAFTSTTSGLVVSFDAGASTDTDGTITGYAWDFGDGTPAGAGQTTTHSYKAGGNYDVALTVTDDQGATTRVTRQVSVVAPATLAADTFGRTATNGWGTADNGGPWTTTGTGAQYTVSDGVGRMTMTKPGSVGVATLGGVSAQDFSGTVDTSIDQPATGNGLMLSLIARQVGKSNYQIKVRYLPNGVVHLVLSKVVNGSETIFKEVNVAGLTYASGDVLRLRVALQTSGANTQLSAKVWKVGTSEPSAAQATQLDGESVLQQAGTIGFQSFLTGSSTIAPLVVSYDNLQVTAG